MSVKISNFLNYRDQPKKPLSVWPCQCSPPSLLVLKFLKTNTKMEANIETVWAVSRITPLLLGQLKTLALNNSFYLGFLFFSQTLIWNGSNGNQLQKLSNQGKETLDVLPFAANGNDFMATIDEQKLSIYKWL